MRAGCPAAKVRTTREVLQMPVVRERDMLQPTSVPGRAEPVQLINSGFVADVDSPGLEGSVQVPELGADTDIVLAELGYSDSEIACLRDQGAI